jgi:hypothetical protein
MSASVIDLSDAILAKLESLEDLAADAGLRVACNSAALDAGQLAAALADPEQAPPPLRRLLSRLPCHEGPDAG